MADVKTARLINKAAVQEQYKQAAPVFKAFNDTGIIFVVHKGAPLSKMIYDDPYHRMSGDIDLLLPRESIDAARGILNGLDFRQGRLSDGVFMPATRQELVFHMAHTHQTMPFYKSTLNPLCPFVCVDVNMEIYWSESCKHTGLTKLLRDRVLFEVLPGVYAPVLPTEKEFLAMCLHHYKDMYSVYLLYHRNGYPTAHLDDISAFMKNVRMDFYTLTEIIREHEAELYVYSCLDAAERFCGESIGKELKDSIYRQEYEENFFSFGLFSEELHRWPCDPVRMIREGLTREVMDCVLSENDAIKIRLNELYVG